MFLGPEGNVESESVSKLHWMTFCEFEEIEKKHEILEYDISTSPQYDYENTLLLISQLAWQRSVWYNNV